MRTQRAIIPLFVVQQPRFEADLFGQQQQCMNLCCTNEVKLQLLNTGLVTDGMCRFLRLSKRFVVRHSKLWLDRATHREAQKDAWAAMRLIRVQVI
jgi:hypothetical protein